MSGKVRRKQSTERRRKCSTSDGQNPRADMLNTHRGLIVQNLRPSEPTFKLKERGFNICLTKDDSLAVERLVRTAILRSLAPSVVVKPGDDSGYKHSSLKCPHRRGCLIQGL